MQLAWSMLMLLGEISAMSSPLTPEEVRIDALFRDPQTPPISEAHFNLIGTTLTRLENLASDSNTHAEFKKAIEMELNTILTAFAEFISSLNKNYKIDGIKINDSHTLKEALKNGHGKKMGEDLSMSINRVAHFINSIHQNMVGLMKSGKKEDQDLIVFFCGPYGPLSKSSAEHLNTIREAVARNEDVDPLKKTPGACEMAEDFAKYLEEYNRTKTIPESIRLKSFLQSAITQIWVFCSISVIAASFSVYFLYLIIERARRTGK